MKAADLNLAELMEFEHGRVAIQGRRLILHDLGSLGQFRRDLIETMGLEQAQRIFTRKGFFWGQADAMAMQKLFQWDNTEEWLKAGPMLSQIEGLAEMEIIFRTMDPTVGRYEMEAVWKNSSEVEQHVNEMGHSEYPVCWALVGYASGYVSYCTGRNVYFVELQCQSTGDVCCVALGKDVDSWGDQIKPHLSFFQAADIQKKVEALTRQIADQQAELSLRRRQTKNKTQVPAVSSAEVRSPAFHNTLELAARVAKFDTTVLITGETGTGKEILARYIHQCSPRVSKPLLAVNCSAMPETLLESELFGYRAGAFTGATRNHQGLFEDADGGTVFLDEIGDISPAMQVKLLRVLQEREVRRVGENQSRPIDVRVISATNQDLQALVRDGRFREDLYFRLHVVQIKVPPLRERREDILPLARYFLHRCSRRLKLPELRLGPGCVDVLLNYSWPGNVRELENALEHAAVMCSGNQITPDLLPLVLSQQAGATPLTAPYRSLEEVELDHIRYVLRITGGNRAEAARILKIGEATLYRKLKMMNQAIPEAGAESSSRT